MSAEKDKAASRRLAIVSRKAAHRRVATTIRAACPPNAEVAALHPKAMPEILHSPQE